MSMMRAMVTALLLGAFAAPAAAQFSDSYNFFKAVKEKDGAKATAILSQPGSTIVNARDYDSGDTALHMVTKRRDPAWMGLLIGKGANVDAKDKLGNTPLVLAAGLNFVDGVQLLLARNANPNLANAQGETPLIKAVQMRDANIVRALLDAGANPDQTDNVAGLSARDYATQDRRAGQIVRLMKDADARKTAAKAPTAG